MMNVFRSLLVIVLAVTMLPGTAQADLVFADSFDHYVTADIGQKWTTLSNGSQFTGTINATGGRNSTQSFRVDWGPSNAAGGFLRKTLSDISGTTAIIGFGFRTNVLPVAAARNPIIAIIDGGDEQLTLDLNPAGTISIYRGGANETLIATSASALSINTYYYLEFKAVIHNSTGSYEVRLNRTNILSGSGIDTQATAATQWTGLEIGRNYSGPTTAATYDFDDFYACDSSGSVNNNFLGPIRVKALYADGAGNSTDFTPSAGSNFQNVDEALTDGDTTYNAETTTGDHDTYTFGAIGLTGTVKGVQTTISARSAGAGGETIRPKTRISTTDYNGTSVNISTTYSYYLEMFNVSPATATAWTVSEIDGAEFGVELQP